MRRQRRQVNSFSSSSSPGWEDRGDSSFKGDSKEEVTKVFEEEGEEDGRPSIFETFKILC